VAHVTESGPSKIGVNEWREKSPETGAPLPLGFSQVLILKQVKVVCFDTLLQVLILNVVKAGVAPLPSLERWEEYVRFVGDSTQKGTTDLDVCQ
jgi:hypothetical protein